MVNNKCNDCIVNFSPNRLFYKIFLIIYADLL